MGVAENGLGMEEPILKVRYYERCRQKEKKGKPSTAFTAGYKLGLAYGELCLADLQTQVNMNMPNDRGVQKINHGSKRTIQHRVDGWKRLVRSRDSMEKQDFIHNMTEDEGEEEPVRAVRGSEEESDKEDEEVQVRPSRRKKKATTKRKKKGQSQFG